MREIIKDIKKAACYQHKALTKVVDTCKADRFIVKLNRINLKNILVNIKRLEDRFIFEKGRGIDN